VVTESSGVSGAVCDLCRGRRRWPIGRLSLPVAFEVEKSLSCTCQVEQVLPRGERGGVRCRRRIEKPDSAPPHDAYGLPLFPVRRVEQSAQYAGHDLGVPSAVRHIGNRQPGSRDSADLGEDGSPVEGRGGLQCFG